MGLFLKYLGIIVMSLSGMCTSYFFFAPLFLSDRFNPMGTYGRLSEVRYFLVPLAIFGGIPFMLGLGLFFWGRKLIKRKSLNEP
jgi:hypothetical protein